MEIRASRLGFHTHLFGEASTTSKSSTPQDYGPVEGFPFRSKLEHKTRNSTPTIWIASASHAHDLRLSPDKVFPNLLETRLLQQGIQCKVLNPSLPGLTLRDNKNQLEEMARKWKPDLVVIYQMSNDLVEISRGGLAEKLSPPTKHPLDSLWWFLENTTTYELIRSNISSRIAAASILDSALPEQAEARYLEALQELIDASHQTGANVVVCTFCVSPKLPPEFELVLLKTAPHLEPSAWQETVTDWNQSIRLHLDRLHVCDLAREVGKSQELFRDPVHFTIQGHEKVAELMAEFLQENWQSVGQSK